MSYKGWTKKKEETLMHFYGVIETTKLCRKLNITYEEFRYRVKVLKLGYQKDYDEYVTMRQVRNIMNIQHYAITRFIKNGLPVKKIVFGVGERYNVIVTLHDLVEWLEKHQDLWSALKVEYMALGSEPIWLKNKRQLERNNI
jgi:hypothetical protein